MKNADPPYLSPKTILSIMAFRIAWTLDLLNLSKTVGELGKKNRDAFIFVGQVF